MSTFAKILRTEEVPLKSTHLIYESLFKSSEISSIEMLEILSRNSSPYKFELIILSKVLVLEMLSIKLYPLKEKKTVIEINKNTIVKIKIFFTFIGFISMKRTSNNHNNKYIKKI